MSAQWDDLLTRLPSESCPPGLLPAIEARLRAERRRARSAGRIMSLAALGATALGSWLITPALQGVRVVAPDAIAPSILAGLSSVLASPSEAVYQGITGTLHWMESALGTLGSGSILALALLAVPACWAAIRLLAVDGPAQGRVA